MGTRNFDAGTRDLAGAGRTFLIRLQEAGGCSFSSMATNIDRWNLFACFAKAEGVGRMERITSELVQKYAEELSDRVLQDDLAIATAHNYVSVVNTVMRAATNWQSVDPVGDCGLHKRIFIRTVAPLPNSQIEMAIESLRASNLPRQAIISELAFEFGLRSKEACLINLRDALNEANTSGRISVRKGTKGGRLRVLMNLSKQNIDLLERGVDIQGKGRNLVPVDQSLSAWVEGGLRKGREILKQYGLTGYHELRAAYACNRYETITGFVAPCVTGTRHADREIDADARYQISKELGHNRIDIIATYVGSKK